jgi:uncharacterized metal-binding protein
VIGGGTEWHGEAPLAPDSGWTLTSKVEQYTPVGYGLKEKSMEFAPKTQDTSIILAVAFSTSVILLSVSLWIYFKKSKRRWKQDKP